MQTPVSLFFHCRVEGSLGDMAGFYMHLQTLQLCQECIELKTSCIWFQLSIRKCVRQSSRRTTRRRSGNLRHGIDLWGLYQSFPVSPAIDPLSVGFKLDRWTSNKRYINQIPQPAHCARNTSRSTVRGRRVIIKIEMCPFPMMDSGSCTLSVVVLELTDLTF